MSHLNEINTLSVCQKTITGAAAVVGIIIAIHGLKDASYLEAGLGVSVALAALLHFYLEMRKEDLVARQKRIPPEVDADLCISAQDGRTIVNISSKNLIPFECKYLLKTKDDVVVSSIFSDWMKIYPSKDTCLFTDHPNIQRDKILDDYLVLVFDYRSLHASEIGDPALSGSIEKEYFNFR